VLTSIVFDILSVGNFLGWGGPRGSVNSYRRLTDLLKVNLKNRKLMKFIIDEAL
jgi:hypothetical protein